MGLQDEVIILSNINNFLWEIHNLNIKVTQKGSLYFSTKSYYKGPWSTSLIYFFAECKRVRSRNIQGSNIQKCKHINGCRTSRTVNGRTNK